MGGERIGVWMAALGLLCACRSSSSRLDLAHNEALYQSSGYTAKVAADRAVCPLPVVDARKAPAVEAAGPYAVQLLPRGAWPRSMSEMLGDVLERELRRSRVFARVTDRVDPGACLLRVEIEELDGGIEEHPTGRRTFAKVALRAKVLGPEGPKGRRDVLLDERFEARQGTDVVMRPVSPRVLIGRALAAAIAAMLARIDQTNVARSGVPMTSDR